MGPRTFGNGQNTVFLGKEIGQAPDYSNAVAENIDAGIGSLLGNAQQTAKDILEANRSKRRLLADRLLLQETIEGAELRELLQETPEEVAAAA